MKNVLVLEDSRKVGFGGGQKGSLEVIEALVGHFEVVATDSVADSIFATRSQEILGKPVHLLRSMGSIVGGDKASFNVGVLELSLYPFFTLWNSLGLLRLIRRGKMSAENAILYVPIKKTLLLAWFVSVITGIPFLYHARNIDGRNRPLFKILERILRRASVILCVSEAVARNLNMPQCQLLYNGIPVQENASAKHVTQTGQTSEESKLVVAAFASLLPWKGLEYLIQAAGLVRNSTKVEVRIFGKGPLEEELRELCPPNCHLLGFAENVNELMASEIHVVCTPSVAEEAFGRVPMEGNSFGLPAIVTDIGAQAEITIDGKTGYHVPPRNAQAIADAIDHMIDNPQHYHTLSKQALEHSKRFDLKAHRARVLTVFQAI